MMRYVLVADSTSKIVAFRENQKNLLIKFLNNNSIEISEENYFTEEEFNKFNLYRHIANFEKTEEEFEEYCRMAKRVGLPDPDKNSKTRPLHEKYAHKEDKAISI